MTQISVLQKISVLFKQVLGTSCVLCHEKTGDLGMCEACLADLPSMPCVCTICAASLPIAGICGRCQSSPPKLDGLFVSFRFAEPLTHLIHAYKYQNQLQLAGVLKQLLVSQRPHFKLNKIDGIFAVPLSRQRLIERGFNQSHELAKMVALKIGKPLLSMDACYREDRPAQAGLNLKARQENIKGIFKLNGDFNNKNILLIDDVVTRGATLNELAKSFKKQGVDTVFGWVLAKKP